MIQKLKQLLRHNVCIEEGSIRICDKSVVDTINELRKHGVSIKIIPGEIIAHKYGYTFRAPLNDATILRQLAEPLEKIYNVTSYAGRGVIDIGAYIGDSAAFFLSKGARRVYAFEPSAYIYKYLVSFAKHLPIVTKRIAMWWKRGTVGICPYVDTPETSYAGPGCRETVPAVTFADILDMTYDADIVKIDCEGCEYALLLENCATLSRIRDYIIEVHGSPDILIDRFLRCGFHYKIVLTKQHAIVVHFYKR